MGVVVVEVEADFQNARVLKVALDAANVRLVMGGIKPWGLEVWDIGCIDKPFVS